ncbi:hypothetical protein FRAAL0506 [Frankia alni ACN14a]|uniref:Uncharacterized protein n=1 Tax=Frankia alni (strain DSM 45986 / CECT 9034 / ACN14a) TaxID=326424 RepID=Q0RTC0_FRAAA|nr:hypothetical protein FRAAL0506 [Frankia alni ACN14a]
MPKTGYRPRSTAQLRPTLVIYETSHIYPNVAEPVGKATLTVGSFIRITVDT